MLTHRMANHPIHKAWMRMNNRCNNPYYEHYHRYGGRGIRVCERWKSFENFYEDVHSTWESGLSLDRYPLLDGNYEPTNFRWATTRQQCNNRSTNRYIFYEGISRTMMEWERFTGIDHRAISLRLEMGWSVKKTLTHPVNKVVLPPIEKFVQLLSIGRSQRQIAKELGISRNAVKIGFSLLAKQQYERFTKKLVYAN